MYSYLFEDHTSIIPMVLIALSSLLRVFPYILFCFPQGKVMIVWETNGETLRLRCRDQIQFSFSMWCCTSPADFPQSPTKTKHSFDLAYFRKL